MTSAQWPDLFDDDQIIVCSQAIQTLLGFLRTRSTEIATLLSVASQRLKNDLGNQITSGFKQNRIHIHSGLNASGFSLNRLSSGKLSLTERDGKSYSNTFCALNGATLRPLSLKIRQKAVTVTLFPTSDAVPRMERCCPFSICTFPLGVLPLSLALYQANNVSDQREGP